MTMVHLNSLYCLTREDVEARVGRKITESEFGDLSKTLEFLLGDAAEGVVSDAIFQALGGLGDGTEGDEPVCGTCKGPANEVQGGPSAYTVVDGVVYHRAHIPPAEDEEGDESRADSIEVGDWVREDGMEFVYVRSLRWHGDQILIFGADGSEGSFDRDTTVYIAG